MSVPTHPGSRKAPEVDAARAPASGQAAASSRKGSVSVIIPAYGNGLHLERCLESLLGRGPIPFTVHVVDDGSPEPIELPGSWPGVRCHRRERNCGPVSAVQYALTQTADDWIVLLNSDVRVGPESLRRLLEVLREYPEYDVAVPKLLRSQQQRVIDSAGDAVLMGGGSYRVGAGERDLGQYDGLRRVPTAASTLCATRRSLLEELGGLDQDFIGFLEDVDLALRARLRGYRCVYVPSAEAFHEGGASFGHWKESDILRLITRNQIWVVAKNFPVAVLWRALPRILVFQTLWLGLMLSRGFLGAYLRGVGQALLGLPRMLRKRREIQAGRKIPAQEFLRLLVQAEREIAAWQRRLARRQRSTLLRWYFGLFGEPSSASSAEADADR
ncbi:MAG: glycosyltransferase family 2 protein [Terriglobia bacterium]